MKIKELLKKPALWTKEAFARNVQGEPVEANDPIACCFCLMGAARRCYPEIESRKIVYRKLRAAVKPWTGREFSDLDEFNDDPRTTHADVLAVAESADV